MKQLLVLSGKGGTGKTTVAGTFIELAEARAWADCDVDAPNLHLIAPLEAPHQLSPHYGMPKAFIDSDICTQCERCLQECRFDAISYAHGRLEVDPLACEGCGLCEALCSVDAIESRPSQTGLVALADDGRRVFATAVLSMGSGNSGKLVYEVKRRLTESAHEGTPLAVIDGSPGIGCPVMSSMSGVELVLIVTEPSVSGRSDLKRLLDVAIGLGLPVAVCVNKSDVNPELTDSIRGLCTSWGVEVVGEIPFDAAVPAAINAGRTLALNPGPAGVAIRAVFVATMRLLDGDPL